MSNQYIETGNNQRPSLTMWQYYWRAWTFPREKRASLREGSMVRRGILSSSMILGFFIVVILEILSGGQGLFNSSSFGKEVKMAFCLSFVIGSLLSVLQFLTIPGLPLFIHRVHDTGKSAWWPFILTCFFWPCWFFFMDKEGDPGTNKYGPPPSL